MTAPSPTDFDPSAGDGSIVGAGLSVLTGRTEANVKAAKKNEVKNNATLTGFHNSVFAGLPAGMALPLGILNAVGQGLGAIGTAVWNTVEAAVTGIGNFVGQFLNAAGKLIGNIAEAVVDGIGTTFQNIVDFLTHVFGRKQPGVNVISNRTPAELVDAAHNLADTAFVAVENTQTLEDWKNDGRVVPAWVGALSDDVSYPHYLINNSANTIFGSGSTTTQDRLIFIPVVASQDRKYDAVKFGVTACTATSVQVAVYDVNETTGLASKWMDLGNRVSDITSQSTTIKTITLSDELPVKKGEVYYIAILANGGTITLSYSSTISGTQLVDYGRYPRFLASYASNGTYTVFPSTLANTLIGSDGTFRPFWGALGTSSPTVIPARLKYNDGFDRPDSASLGAAWVKRYGNGLRIVSGKAQANSTSGTSINTYVSRLNWLDQRVQATMNRGTYYSGAAMVLILRSNSNGKFAYLRVTQSLGSAFEPMNVTARIYTNWGTSFNIGTDFTGGTARSDLYSANIGLNFGPVDQVWRFEAIGNAYYAYLNDSLILPPWTDSGYSAFPADDSFKEVGVGGRYWTGVGSNTPYTVIDNWSAGDI